MKKILTLATVIFSVLIVSCSSDDDDGKNAQTANIAYSITTTRNTEAIIETTFNENTQTETNPSLPFSATLTQREVSSGTYLKLTFLENGIYEGGTGGQTGFTDYEATLLISVDGDIVANETFDVFENTGLLMIDYTF